MKSPVSFLSENPNCVQLIILSELYNGGNPAETEHELLEYERLSASQIPAASTGRHNL